MGLEGPGGEVKPRTEHRGEIVSLTSLRGVLALWVVFYHFWSDVVRLFSAAEVASPIARFGGMAVPAFFMLSGFVLSYNYADRFSRLHLPDVGRFLFLRLARVYPVHLVSLLVVLAMVLVSRRVGLSLTDSGYTARDFVLNLFLVHTWVPQFKLNWNYPSWSISSEWFAYILFPFAVRFGLKHLKTPSRAVAVGVVSLAAAIAMVLWWRPWPFFELLLVVPTFLAGAAVFWMTRASAGKLGIPAVRWMPELLIVLSVVVMLAAPAAGVSAWLLVAAFGLLIVFVLLGEQCSGLWLVWPMVFLGEVSYSLYMTHTLAQKVVYELLPAAHFASANVAVKSLVLIAYAAAVAAACLGSYFLVERPARVHLKRWSSRFRANKSRLVELSTTG